MCLLAIQYRTFADAPIMIAANRDEYFDRPADGPAIHRGDPRVFCGTDRRAGGTWLGVNEHALVVAVTNRLKSNLPPAPRSRGLLCRDLLGCRNADEAIDQAMQQLATGQYAGANFLCADWKRAAVIQATDELRLTELPPGLHLVTNAELDDRTDERQLLVRYLFAARFPHSPAAFLARAANIFSGRDVSEGQNLIVLRGPDRGTVSSTLLAIARDPGQSVYRYSDGPPDRAAYQDYSPLVRELLTPAASCATD